MLWRGFADAVESHAHWDGGVEGHALMLAAHLSLLSEELAALPERRARVGGERETENDQNEQRADALAPQRFLLACLEPLRLHLRVREGQQPQFPGVPGRLLE